MRKRRRWLWIVLFVWVALLLGSLATSWNVVLVRDYQKMLELAGTLPRPFDQRAPWMSLILGTTGFVAALVTLIFFFLKVLHEMRVNQMQSEFLATVSHELKTPIAALELASSLIRSGGLSPD
jgi:signal transduction histidine kinase